MKKTLLSIALACAMFCGMAHAQAVNNRTIILDTPVLNAAGYRLYCGTTNVTANFAVTPVFDQVGGAAFSKAVAFADTVKFCAMKAYAVGGLESVFGTVVSVTVPDAPVIRITTIDTFALDTGRQLSHVVTASVE